MRLGVCYETCEWYLMLSNELRDAHEISYSTGVGFLFVCKDAKADRNLFRLFRDHF